jgi:hypothetical protein
MLYIQIGGIIMERDNREGGLKLKGDYAQPSLGYDQSTFGRTYDAPYSYDGSSNSESYQNSVFVMDDTVTGIMTGAFMFMFMALMVTGITAFLTAASDAMMYTLLSNSVTFYLLFGIEFAVVFGANAAMKHNNVVLSAVLFFVYAVVNGLTLSVIFFAFQLSSIQTAFFSTAVIFGLMALVGKITHKDLSSFGSILMVGLIGSIIVSLINIFIGSSMLDTGICVITIIIFMGLTAYDTQKIERMATDNAGYSPMVISLWGAMELYLDFVNLFLRILSLFGKRK